MKKEIRNKSLSIKQKTAFWAKKPENIVLIIILTIVTIIGIIDDNLEIIAMVYAFTFVFGLLLGMIFYLKDKFF
jgi:hypothetical protein